jgi:hypothetical protein
MDKIVQVSTPKIAPGAVIPHAVMTLDEFCKNTHRLKALGTWKPGAAGHYSLPLYFDDGATGTNRPCLIQIKGFSTWGLGFFKGESEVPIEPKEDKKEKKKRKTARADFSLDYDQSPQVQKADMYLNVTISQLIQGQHMKAFKNIASPGDGDVAVIQRRAARAPSGQITKRMSFSCFPGRTQLNWGGVDVAMKDFPQEEGDYSVVFEVKGVDASFANSVITYGVVLHGKSIKNGLKIERAPLQHRDEEEEKEGEGEKEDLTEAALIKKVKGAKQAMEKEEKEKKKQTKKRKAKKELNDPEVY